MSKQIDDSQKTLEMDRPRGSWHAADLAKDLKSHSKKGFELADKCQHLTDISIQAVEDIVDVAYKTAANIRQDVIDSRRIAYQTNSTFSLLGDDTDYSKLTPAEYAEVAPLADLQLSVEALAATLESRTQTLTDYVDSSKVCLNLHEFRHFLVDYLGAVRGIFFSLCDLIQKLERLGE